MKSGMNQSILLGVLLYDQVENQTVIKVDNEKLI